MVLTVLISWGHWNKEARNLWHVNGTWFVVCHQKRRSWLGTSNNHIWSMAFTEQMSVSVFPKHNWTPSDTVLKGLSFSLPYVYFINCWWWVSRVYWHIIIILWQVSYWRVIFLHRGNGELTVLQEARKVVQQAAHIEGCSYSCVVHYLCLVD